MLGMPIEEAFQRCKFLGIVLVGAWDLRGRLVFQGQNAKWVFAELRFWRKKKEKPRIFVRVGLGVPWSWEYFPCLMF